MPDLHNVFQPVKSFYLFLVLAPVLVAITIVFGNKVVDYLDKRSKRKRGTER